MGGRHELKYPINAADAAALRARLRTAAKLDGHAGPDGCYIVRSLYFDNYSDKAIVEKLSGQSRREKFRLRYYNNDTTRIRLEKKSKLGRLSYKESAVITEEQCKLLLTGNYSAVITPDEPLLTELYAKIGYQQLRPRSVVTYRREAYIYRAGNVRVTLDSDIRTSNSAVLFLNPELITIPAAAGMILEVKYDGFLPDIIRDILQTGARNQTEFSKYVAARLV